MPIELPDIVSYQCPKYIEGETLEVNDVFLTHDPEGTQNTIIYKIVGIDKSLTKWVISYYIAQYEPGRKNIGWGTYPGKSTRFTNSTKWYLYIRNGKILSKYRKKSGFACFQEKHKNV